MDYYINCTVTFVLAECPVLVLVTVTVSEKVFAEDVGGVTVPPHPATRIRTINPANTRARYAALRFFLPNASPTIPSTGNKAADRRGIPPWLCGAIAIEPDAATVRLTLFED